MSSAPIDLRRARAYICEATGLSAAAVGIVGDAGHTWGYHLGRDRIYTIPPGRGDRDPSVRHARDRDGLTDDASALDIGWHGRLPELGRYLLGIVQSGDLAGRDICELIAERADGTHLWSWSRSGGLSGTPHVDIRYHHLHVSYRRDSRERDKVELYRDFYEPEATMRTIWTTGERLRTFAAGTPYYRDPEAVTPMGTITDERVVYEVLGDLRAGDVSTGSVEWWLIDGGGSGQPARYVRAA